MWAILKVILSIIGLLFIIGLCVGPQQPQPGSATAPAKSPRVKYDPDKPKILDHSYRPPKAEKQAVEKAACRENLKCWGMKHNADAILNCIPLIERLAKYGYEWTDSLLGTKFDAYQWKNRHAGTLIYSGDKVKFQNGFGAWQRMNYWCSYDPAVKTASVEVFDTMR